MNFPLIINSTNEEILAKLSIDNMKIIGTSVRHLFCSVCGYDHYISDFLMIKNGCAVCKSCRYKYHKLLPDLGRVEITEDNFVYLDQHIGWSGHKSYVDETSDFIRVKN